MKLRKLITLNWGNIPNREYEFGDVSFVIGDSGAGKSTLVDAIQTVMTAAKHGLFTYNAGQGEADRRKRNQKSSRSLPSYILGEDQTLFSRPNTERTLGVVTAVFSEGEECFSAIVHASAYLEISGGSRTAKQSELSLFVFRNVKLGLDDFLLDGNNEQRQIRDSSSLEDHLTKTYPDGVLRTFNDKKEKYLIALYGEFWGLQNAPVQKMKRAAKAFTNYIHPRPEHDLNKYIKNELLGERPLETEVQKLSDLLRLVNKNADDAKKLEENNLSLKEAKKGVEAVLTRWWKWEKSHLEILRKSLLEIQSNLQKKEEDVLKQRQRVTQLTEELENGEGREKEAHNRLLEALKDFNENEVLKREAELKKLMETDEEKFLENQNSFLEKHTQFKKMINSLNDVGTYLDELAAEGFEHISTTEAKKVISSIASCVEEVDISTLSTLLEQTIKTFDTDVAKSLMERLNPVDIALTSFQDIYNSAFEGSQEPLADLLDDARQLAKNKAEEYSVEVKQIQKDIEALENETGSLYPLWTKQELERIKIVYPDANASVLCDYIEVKEEEWQRAIEGYVKNNRYALIVEPAYEREVIDFVRDEKMQCKILQGEKLRDDYEERGDILNPRSIVNQLIFSHPVAKAYMHLNYGNVVQVVDSEALRKTPRGVTKSCQGSTGYAMFQCFLPDEKLSFGARARKKALEALKKKFPLVENELFTWSKRHQILRKIKERFKSDFEINSIGSAINRLIPVSVQYADHKSELDSLDLTGTDNLKQRKEEAERNHSDIRDRNTQFTKALASAETILESTGKEIGNITSELSKKQTEFDQQHSNIQSLLPLTSAPESCEHEINEILSRNEFEDLIDEDHKSYLLDVLNKAHNICAKHNSQCLYEMSIEITPGLFEYARGVEKYKLLASAQQRIQDKLDRLCGQLLYEKRHELEQHKEQFKTVFKEDFCSVIYNEITSGQQVVTQLNGILRSHRFGEERYKIDSNLSDGLKHYYDYFKSVHDSKQLGGDESVFEAETKQNNEFIEIEKNIYELLIHVDDDRSEKELKRISDFRNYRDYDVKKILTRTLSSGETEDHEISLNEIGTDSGGQAETSYYIIRSIAAISALEKESKRSGRSLKMLLIDEGFEKVDALRGETIIKYLTNTLGFQLICIMTTKQLGVFEPLATDTINFAKERGFARRGELDTQVFVQHTRMKREQVAELYGRKIQEVMNFAENYENT